MPRKMRINRLTQDELSYELTIRGIGTGTCERMRTSLAKVMQMEKEGSSLERPPYPYTLEQDKEAVTEKLEEITAGVSSFKDGRASGQYVKWETKLNHILGRVEQMKVPEGDEETQKEKSELYARILELMADLDQKAGECDKHNLTPAELSILQLGDAPDNDSSGDEVVNNTSGLSATGTIIIVIKSTPVFKWEVHFTGEKKGMSLNAFLQRIEELRLARHVDKEELFDTAVDLFKGKALIWYRAVRKEVNNWDALVKLSREEFQPSDYNERVGTKLLEPPPPSTFHLRHHRYL